MFSAASVVALNLNENRGGVAPGGYRGNSTLNVLEYDMIVEPSSEDERDRHLTRLKSFDFLEGVIDQFNLLPIVFPDQWDQKNEQWLEGQEPSLQEAVDLFRSKFISVGKHGSTDMITVGIMSEDPRLSQTLANSIPKLYNDYNLKREVDELTSRRTYLEKRLSEIRSRESQQSIYRLLESQLAVESLLYARTNYPLEIIIPASTPRFKSSPKRKVWAIAGFVGSVIFSIFIVLASSVMKAFLGDLRAFSDSQRDDGNEEESTETIVSVGDKWIDQE